MSPFVEVPQKVVFLVFDPSSSIFAAFPPEIKQECGSARPVLGAAAPCLWQRDDGGSAHMLVMQSLCNHV